MSQPTSMPPDPPPETLPQTLEQVQRDEDPGPRPDDAVTDSGVAPGHNRLEDREGA